MANTVEEDISQEKTESNHDDETISLKTSWRSLFHFTTVLHLPLLLAALLVTITAAVARVIFALYLGKLFQILSQFGTGAITGPQLMEQARDKTFILLILGGATWLLSSCFFFVWIVFAELQVRGAGKNLFGKLLTREFMWFDMRKDGVGSFLSHSQKYDFHLLFLCQSSARLILTLRCCHEGNYENFRSQLLSPLELSYYI
jgi:ATP-binding cassette subfamily B (MDR/TAP) protein 1